jgi:hypothetical protein
MRRISALGAATLLAVVPAVANAQSTPTTGTEEVVVKESSTVVVKEAPKPPPVTFTPYGFLLLNAFFNDAPGLRNFPLPARCSGGASCEGNVFFNVTQTRLGANLAFDDKAGWTQAVLSARVEIDFKGGNFNSTSNGAYNAIPRLRKAYVDAVWGSESRFDLRIGQDDRLIAPLRGVSLAYVADPVFQYAGGLNGRAPMIALRYTLSPKNGLGVSVGAAALNPQDSSSNLSGTAPSVAVDLGAGNRSRIPNFEGRVGVSWSQGGRKIVDLGGWAGWQKNRFVNPATDANLDVNSYIYGGDMTLNLWVFQVMGQIMKGYGYDVPGTLGAAQGIALGFDSATPPINITVANAVPAFAGWFQVSARPIEPIQVYAGWGGTQSDTSSLQGTVLAVAGTRVQNFMWAAGATAYAGKHWRFSAEYGSATSFFYSGDSFTQGQFSINSQLVF